MQAERNEMAGNRCSCCPHSMMMPCMKDSQRIASQAEHDCCRTAVWCVFGMFVAAPLMHRQVIRLDACTSARSSLSDAIPLSETDLSYAMLSNEHKLSLYATKNEPCFLQAWQGPGEASAGQGHGSTQFAVILLEGRCPQLVCMLPF